MSLEPGLVGTASLVVSEEHTAARMGSGRAPVLASPIMIALMEAAAVDCVERLLPAGQESVGVRVEAEHLAATPVGVGVTARARLEEVSGRTLSFAVEASDGSGIIGRGRHTRLVVDAERFRARAGARLPRKA